MSKVVLILTVDMDTEVDPVIRLLRARDVPVFRYDTSYFPINSSLVAVHKDGRWATTLTAYQRSLELSDVGSVWYRRPTTFGFDPSMQRRQRSFAHAEARRAFGGLLLSLRDVTWVNHPERAEEAEFKPYQLQVATEVGLRVPPSLITNDPGAAQSFYHEHNREVIYKTLSWPQTIHDIETTDLPAHVILTSKLEDGHLKSLGRVRHTACLFQELVPKAADIRVVVTGRRALAAEIGPVSPRDSSIDFRSAYSKLRYASHRLPDDVATRCVAVVKRLGLSSAALDLILSKDGDYVFLEANPSGQALWLEQDTGLPIAAAFADLLSEGRQ